MKPRVVAVALLCLVWVGFGIYGALSYGQRYYTYRGFDPPKDPVGVSPGRIITVHFHSEALRARRSYEVYLPPGYSQQAAAGARFPVLYLLHGSPGGADLFLNAADVGVDMDTLVASHRIKPFLIVLPHGGDGTFRSDTEWADTAHGRYESFLLDVVRNVDASFPTLDGRRYRALAGDSEGAYAAVNLALRHLGEFSIAESWSGYFMQERHGPFAHASPLKLAANSPSIYVPTMRARLHRYPLHAFIYCGSRERVVPKARAFAAELRAAGGHASFAVYPGSHDWRLWRLQAPHMLMYADRWFGPR
jgi:enterochelin esterase-like enzyme